MCKKTKYKSCNVRIDKCMVEYVKIKQKSGLKTLASCCGHDKYPVTLVIQGKTRIYEYISGKTIPRKKRFYKRDKEGYYFIPETIITE